MSKLSNAKKEKLRNLGSKFLIPYFLNRLPRRTPYSMNCLFVSNRPPRSPLGQKPKKRNAKSFVQTPNSNNPSYTPLHGNKKNYRGSRYSDFLYVSTIFLLFSMTFKVFLRFLSTRFLITAISYYHGGRSTENPIGKSGT